VLLMMSSNARMLTPFSPSGAIATTAGSTSHLLPNEPSRAFAAFQHILQEVKVTGKLCIGEAR
jgi:hypothetical protein